MTQSIISDSGRMPRFSIVTPVYDPPADVLLETIATVQAQTFSDWELILVDDRSPSPHVLPILREAAAADTRITVIERKRNGGIVAASNDGLAAARGEFIALLDHDDTLDRRALELVQHYAELHPQMDYCYSDEDHLSLEGRYVNAFYKPDWSPERLRSQNYCCHFSVFRASLLAEIGGFRAGFEGSQDYDLILRATERARTVVHVPLALYHWRQLPTSVAGDPNAKPYAYEAGRRAVQEHCDRTGIDAVVEDGLILGTYRVRRVVAGDPLVSIIIPTCGSMGRPWGIERCYAVAAIESVRKHTSRRIEFVLVVDDWTPPEYVEAMRRAAGDTPTTIVWYDRPFNFSEKINLGSIHAKGDLLLLLNDDIEVISDEFLDPMIPLAMEDGVGAVGAKLYFEDGRLQHAGHVYNGDPYHILFKWSGDELGPSGMLRIERECIGVTAACLLVRPEVFAEVGGLCTAFPSSFNDVDFNLKLHVSGYRQVWTPYTELFHFESASRDPKINDEDHILIRRRWADRLEVDPYYNPNLEPRRDDWVERGFR
jgi:O-antigen biosynthesis protein